jgi:putative transposase
MSAVDELVLATGIVAACLALGVPRATLYRLKSPPKPKAPQPRPRPARALSNEENQTLLDLLHSPRFRDQSPAEIYATLLDEGRYLCSVRTLYRLLAARGESRERRNQLTHPAYSKPELLAVRPNQVWSWDITKLKGPGTWNHFHLYVIIDIFSRCVVGWMVAEHESAALAELLIAETCAKEGIEPGTLTLHADRGTSMKSKPVALLLSDLGVHKTHSRPQVSDDNPYSEAQFKTMKYRPEFPESFGSLEDARAFVRGFMHWYNEEHHHSGLGFHTPRQVHSGVAAKVREARQVTLTAAYEAHPERFVRKAPTPPKLPTAAWINPPKVSTSEPRPPLGRAEVVPPGLGGVAPAPSQERAL